MFHSSTLEPRDSALISNIAQISMTDSPSPMVRPELSHTHKKEPTAEPTTDLHKVNQDTFHTFMLEPRDSALISNIAQISMTDSPLPMVRPELSHTHKKEPTAEPITDLHKNKVNQDTYHTSTPE